MLVEIEEAGIPKLITVVSAQPGEFKVFSSGNLNMTTIISTMAHPPIDLNYEIFKWAYSEAVKRGDGILDLKNENLPRIKQAYAQHLNSDPKSPTASFNGPRR